MPFPKNCQIVHTDICGPMKINSLGGAKYFIKFMYDASRWTEVYFLKKKSDTLKTFKDLEEYGRKPERLQNKMFTI